MIVTFFCQRYGRLTGIAKGARRSKKRFVNKLEIFSSLLISHTVPQNNRLAFIAEADLTDAFITLRQNISRFTTASILSELVLLATKEIEGDDNLYPLLIWAYNSLNTNHPPLSVLILFLIRFYTIIGYGPQLTNCLQCGQDIQTNQDYRFHSSTGGIHCGKCTQQNTTNSLTLSKGTLRSLATALQQPLNRLHRLRLSSTIQKEALTFLHSYGRHLFQREIVSWTFLDSACNP